MNLCTDQLAVLLADPGQVVSVSWLGHDPRSSAYAERVQAVPANNGGAEEVVRLNPDLVLAGTFTTRATVSMLQRLGYRVALFAPITSLAEARADILRMGDLLGQEARAQAMVADFDARLAAMAGADGPAPRTALYYALGSTAGRDTLPGDILAAAGMANIAEQPYGGALPLEKLILADPDLILIGRPYGGHSRATELLRHPVLRGSGALRTIPDGADWACGTPALLDAVAQMQALRRDWQASR